MKGWICWIRHYCEEILVAFSSFWGSEDDWVQSPGFIYLGEFQSWFILTSEINAQSSSCATSKIVIASLLIPEQCFQSTCICWQPTESHVVFAGAYPAFEFWEKYFIALDAKLFESSPSSLADMKRDPGRWRLSAGVDKGHGWAGLWVDKEMWRETRVITSFPAWKLIEQHRNGTPF